jgi:hypothetical protein
MRGHYEVKRSSFILIKYHFSTQYPSTLMHLSYLGTSLKIPSRKEIGHLHLQPSMKSHLHFLIIVKLASASVVQAAQRNYSPMAQGQDYGIDRPQFLAEGTAATLVSNVRCVVLHCRPEGSHLATMSNVFLRIASRSRRNVS